MKHMDRTLAAHRWLAISSLALAAIAYCAPNLLHPSLDAAPFHIAPADVVSLTHSQNSTTITLLCSGGKVDEVQVVDGPTESRAAADGPVPPAAPARYRPSAQAQALLARLAPPQSLRSLGTPDAAHLQSFGLTDAASAHLRLTTTSQTFDLTLGRSIYGAGDVYAAVDKKHVFVFGAWLVHDFDHAGAALWDPHVLSGFPGPFGQLVVSHKGSTRTFRRGTSAAQPEAWAQPAAELLRVLDSLVFLTAATDAPSMPPTTELVLQPANATLPAQVVRVFASAEGSPTLTATGLLSPVLLSRAAAQGLEEAVLSLQGSP